MGKMEFHKGFKGTLNGNGNIIGQSNMTRREIPERVMVIYGCFAGGKSVQMGGFCSQP